MHLTYLLVYKVLVWATISRVSHLPSPSQMQAQPSPAADPITVQSGATADTLNQHADKLILERQYTKFVSLLQSNATNVAFVQHAYHILRTWCDTKERIPVDSDTRDIYKILTSPPQNTIFVLLYVMKQNQLNIQIQRNGIVILSFFAVHFGERFHAKYIVPFCTVALEAMSMCVVDSDKSMIRRGGIQTLQHNAVKLLNIVSSLDANLSHHDEMRNAGQYDLVLLVLRCLKKIHFFHAQMHGVQPRDTTQTRVATTLDSIFVCFELLGRFSSKWICPPAPTVGVDDEMYLCVTDAMNAFPNCVKMQTRGCVVLMQLATLNLKGLNRDEMPHIICALNFVQNQSFDNYDQLMGTRALLKFVEEDCDKQLYHKEAQDIMGATGAMPILLNRLKRLYDTNNNTAVHAEYLVGFLDVLKSITHLHHKNCELLYLADGVTLIVAVVSVRRIQKANSVEIAGVRVLCHMMERMYCYETKLKDAMYIRARTVLICHSNNSFLHDQAHYHPISIIMATAVKKPVPALVINECLDALCSCAESAANRDVIGLTGVALAVALDKAGYTRGATILLAHLTHNGAFADDAAVRNIATRTNLPKKSTLAGITFPASQNIKWRKALLLLRLNLNIAVQPSAIPPNFSASAPVASTQGH